MALISNSGCAKQKNVLVYTKNGKGFVHKNLAASIDCVKRICARNGWACEASDQSSIFTAETIAKFDVIVFSNTNNETIDTDAQKQVFKNFINNGGGFVAIHSACASERQWPWYWANVGCKFVRHPKLQPFDVKVIDHDHPSTSFLPDIWKWTGECYFLDHFNPDINVLLAADIETVDDAEKYNYPNCKFGRHLLPLCWWHQYDGGRQWYTALGHNISCYTDETFVKHIEGGIKWAMDKSR